MLKAKVRLKCVTFSFLCCYGNMLMANKRDDNALFNYSLSGRYSRHEAKRRVEVMAQHIK